MSKSPVKSPRIPIRAAFTLVELLVVIAVIVILVSILVPAFTLAREGAHRATCQSNLKQIGFGLIQYSQDNDEILISDWYGTNSTIGPEITPPEGTVPGSYKWMDAVYPYLKNEQVFTCPSAVNVPAIPASGSTPATPPLSPADSWHYFGELTAPIGGSITGSTYNPIYNFGSYVIMHGYGPPEEVGSLSITNPAALPPVSHALLGSLINLSQAKSPATTIWVTDGNGAFFAQFDSTTSTIANVIYRHFGNANALYLDGHVKSVTSAQLNQLDPTGSFIGAATITGE